MMKNNCSMHLSQAFPSEEAKCSCLIPFYNEGSRILDVLKIISQVDELSEVICVDDGSDDCGAERIMQKYPDYKLIRLPCNLGKTGAVQEGLKHITSNYVLLIDADLHLLKSEEISLAIKTIIEFDSIDMIILRRINAGIYSKLNRGDTLYAGERILKIDDLKAAFTKSARGYQLEVMINKHMKDNRKTVYWMPSSALNTYKIKKTGFIKGIIAEINMINEILTCYGVKEYYIQYKDFALRKAPNNKTNFF